MSGFFVSSAVYLIVCFLLGLHSRKVNNGLREEIDNLQSLLSRANEVLDKANSIIEFEDGYEKSLKLLPDHKLIELRQVITDSLFNALKSETSNKLLDYEETYQVGYFEYKDNQHSIDKHRELSRKLVLVIKEIERRQGNLESEDVY